MKLRIDFVTNSSSSSFLVPVKEEYLKSVQSVQKWLGLDSLFEPQWGEDVSAREVAALILEKIRAAAPLKEFELVDTLDRGEWYPASSPGDFLRRYPECEIYVLEFEDHDPVEAEIERGEILEKVGALVQSCH